LSDDFASVIGDLDRNISKTYAEKIVGIFKQSLPHEIHLLQKAIEERAHYQAVLMSILRFTQGYQMAHFCRAGRAERLVNYRQNLLSF